MGMAAACTLNGQPKRPSNDDPYVMATVKAEGQATAADLRTLANRLLENLQVKSLKERDIYCTGCDELSESAASAAVMQLTYYFRGTDERTAGALLTEFSKWPEGLSWSIQTTPLCSDYHPPLKCYTKSGCPPPTPNCSYSSTGSPPGNCVPCP
jgi:hypothetical protein